MLPTLVPGELVTVVRRWRRVRVGDLVVVRDPREASRWLIKRCVARHGRLVEVRGDNPGASTDSRDFGPVTAAAIRYLVVGVGRPGSPPERPGNS
jgi:nickel-type superoxide dismutase maturation protease